MGFKWYDTLFVDGEDFIDIGRDFEENCTVRKGLIGGAEIRLMRQRDIVDYAVKWIEENRNRDNYSEHGVNGKS